MHWLLACVGAASDDLSSEVVVEPGDNIAFQLKVKGRGGGSRSSWESWRIQQEKNSENWALKGYSKIICALNIKHTSLLKIKRNLCLSYSCSRLCEAFVSMFIWDWRQNFHPPQIFFSPPKFRRGCQCILHQKNFKTDSCCCSHHFGFHQLTTKEEGFPWNTESDWHVLCWVQHVFNYSCKRGCSDLGVSPCFDPSLLSDGLIKVSVQQGE